MHSEKILTTYFEPFNQAKFNASSGVKEAIAGLDSFATPLCLPVSFAQSWPKLEEHLKTFQPKGLLCFGESGTREAICMERIAINWMSATIADNDGYVANGIPLVPGGEEGIFSTLPIQKLINHSRIKASPYPIEISNSAGAFVCNQVMYHSLRWGRTHQVPVGFIHVPALRPAGSLFSPKWDNLIESMRNLAITFVEILGKSPN